MEYDDLLNMGTELGYQLMFSGAEIYRVEESVYRLLTAYGLQPQVFAIPNCLIVSLNTPQGHPITRMRRIPSHGTDIELLERCNDLCRRLCREVPPVKQAKELDGYNGTAEDVLTNALFPSVAPGFFTTRGEGPKNVGKTAEQLKREAEQASGAANAIREPIRYKVTVGGRSQTVQVEPA